MFVLSFGLTHKAPPTICSRWQFLILLLFQKYQIRDDISWELSAGRRFSWNITPYFCRKLGKMLQNLSSAAVVIGALWVHLFPSIYNNCRLLTYLMMYINSLYCRHYGPRSECSYGSILIRGFSICFHDKCIFRCNIYAADVKCRRQFQNNVAYIANTMNPDQNAPIGIGAFWSGVIKCLLPW